jgi:hypothetical protein
LVALEYDASKKSNHRYKAKIADYYKHSTIPAVFYIAKNKAILSMVKNAEHEVVKDSGKKFKFYYAELPDVLRENSPMTFESLSGHIFKF